MTDTRARTIANVALATAGMAVAYVVLTRAPFRRLLSRAVRIWLGASVPLYLAGQAQQAWTESGRAQGKTGSGHRLTHHTLTHVSV